MNGAEVTYRERLAVGFVFLLTLLVSVYFFPRWADPNQNSRLDMVVAIVDDGTFEIDPYVSNTVDYAEIDGHYYSDKAPGVALLGVPVYASLRPFLNMPWMERVTGRLANHEAFASTLREGGSGVFEEKLRFAILQVVLGGLFAALPTAILACLMFLYLGRLVSSVPTRLLVVLAYTLATPAFAYSAAFYGHQLAAAMLFFVFYVLSRMGSNTRSWHLVVVGLVLGYAVVTEYPAALPASVLWLYALHRSRKQGRLTAMVPLTASCLVIALGWMVYNNTVFGGPLELGYSHSALWQEQHHTGFLSLTRPRFDALFGITFGAFRGLFLLSPWLLLSIPGFFFWWRLGDRKADALCSAGCALPLFLFNASSVMWWGGFAIGPRYLLPGIPFLALPAVFAVERLARSWERVLLLFLLGISLISTWGLSLAGQAFPPDSIRDPFTDYALVHWLEGDIARNLGTVLGFEGTASLLPLVVLVTSVFAVYVLLNRRLAQGEEELVRATEKTSLRREVA